jgi:hypothetical protein
MRNTVSDQTTTTPAVRGRPFAKGNGGRRPGSKNQSTLILAALSDGGKEELMHKGYELAMAGDVSMLKFFLSRMLPRERPVKIDLPRMEFADDAVEALGAITAAVGEGRITPNEAAWIEGCEIELADIDLGLLRPDPGRDRFLTKRERKRQIAASLHWPADWSAMYPLEWLRLARTDMPAAMAQAGAPGFVPERRHPEFCGEMRPDLRYRPHGDTQFNSAKLWPLAKDVID